MLPKGYVAILAKQYELKSKRKKHPE